MPKPEDVTATRLASEYGKVQRERLRAAKELKEELRVKIALFVKKASKARTVADKLADELDELGVQAAQNAWADPAVVDADEAVDSIDSYISELEDVVDELPEIESDAKAVDEDAEEDEDEEDDDEVEGDGDEEAEDGEEE